MNFDTQYQNKKQYNTIQNITGRYITRHYYKNNYMQLNWNPSKTRLIPLAIWKTTSGIEIVREDADVSDGEEFTVHIMIVKIKLYIITFPLSEHYLEALVFTIAEKGLLTFSWFHSPTASRVLRAGFFCFRALNLGYNLSSFHSHMASWGDKVKSLIHWLKVNNPQPQPASNPTWHHSIRTGPAGAMR